MGIFAKNGIIALQIFVLTAIAPLSVQAKLVHTLSELRSEQMLRRHVFQSNNNKFHLKKSIQWLKKKYPTTEDHRYIDQQIKKNNVRIKPVLFYYDDYIEIRSFGRSYGKISNIDTLKNIIQLNGQDIYFKKGQSIANVHQQIISAMEGHVSWSPLELLIPKAEAFPPAIAMISLFFMVQSMQRAKASTYEGSMQQAAVNHCQNPGTTSRDQSLSFNDRQMINFAFHTNQNCSVAANQFITANPPMTPDRIARAHNLCMASRRIKQACDMKKFRESQPSTTPSTTSAPTNM